MSSSAEDRFRPQRQDKGHIDLLKRNRGGYLATQRIRKSVSSICVSSAITKCIPDELGLVKRKPDQFKVEFVLDKPPSGWKGHSGYVDQKILSQALPGAAFGDRIKIFVCMLISFSLSVLLVE